MDEELSVRIMFLITGLGTGGAERQLVNLTRALKEGGAEVCVVSMLEPGFFAEAIRGEGINVHSLNFTRGRLSLLGVMKLHGLIRRWRPDILHTHMVHANLLGRMMKLVWWHLPVISTIHNMYDGGRFYQLAYRLTNRLAVHTTQVSKQGLDAYRAKGLLTSSRSSYVPNGLETAMFERDNQLRTTVRESMGWSSFFVWIAVGRLEQSKDYANMLHAYATYRRNVIDVPSLLIIVGEGPLRSVLERLSLQLGLPEREVQFVGRRTDISALLNAADGFLMSSEWEGTPMAILEASASGLPVVATNVGGIADAILHGETGFLAPPSDSAHLAMNMQELVRLSSQQRSAMGARGYAHIEANYGIASVAAQWINLYSRFTR